MLKYDVTYENFDGEKETRTLYFDLGRRDLLKMPNGLVKRLEDTTPEEIAEDPLQVARDVIAIVLLAYGERQGDRFVKSKKISKRFEESLAFETFLDDLLNKEGTFERFVQGVFPAEVAREAMQKAAKLNKDRKE